MSTPGPKKGPSNTVGTVDVHTWGTSDNGSNGATQFVDSHLSATPTGHAALEVTFPADAEGERLIEEYCQRDNGGLTIPYERVSVPTGDPNSPTKDVFKVLISWWSTEDATKGFVLTNTMNDDQQNMRQSQDSAPLNPRFATLLPQQEERRRKGKLNTHHQYLSPLVVTSALDTKALSPEQQKLVDLEVHKQLTDDKIYSLGNALKRKLPEGSSKIKVDATLIRILDKHSPNWKQALNIPENGPLPSTLNQQEGELLRAHVISEMKSAANISNDLKSKIEEARALVIAESMMALYDEVDDIEKKYNALPENERKKMLEERPEFSEAAYQLFEIVTMQKAQTENYDLLINIPDDQLAIIMKENTSKELTSLQNSLMRAEAELEIDVTEENQTPEIQKSIKDNTALIQSLKTQISKEEERIKKIQEIAKTCLPQGSKNIKTIEITSIIAGKVKYEARAKKEEISDALKVIQSRKISSNAFLARDMERYISRGLPPAHTITLPGMNVEKMLKKMRELVEDNKPYNTYTKNCALVASTVLQAGASSNLRSYFEPHMFGGFASPQQVMQSATKYNSAVVQNQGNMPLLDRAQNMSPLNTMGRLGAAALKGRLETKSTSAKVGYTAALGVVGVGVVVSEAVKAVVTPKSTFNNATGFIQYAAKSESAVLKGLMIPAVIGAAIVAPLAAVQVAVEKAIVNPIKNATQKIKQKQRIENDPFKVATAPSEQAKTNTSKVVEVKGKDQSPADILKAMQNRLAEKKIPALDKDARTVMKSATPEQNQQFNDLLRQVSSASYANGPEAKKTKKKSHQRENLEELSNSQQKSRNSSSLSNDDPDIALSMSARSNHVPGVLQAFRSARRAAPIITENAATISAQKPTSQTPQAEGPMLHGYNNARSSTSDTSPKATQKADDSNLQVNEKATVTRNRQ